MDAPSLRRGWTTGACATAAAKAAGMALLHGEFPDPVSIALPRGGTAAFSLAETARGPGWAMAAIVKDAGDDPDVTHGALIRSTIRPGGAGLRFVAGPGVGTVTRPGLALPPGEPAINPVPRRMIADALAGIAGCPMDAEVEIGIDDGAALAEQTLNGRLGIVGGLSVLGTTGIVIPFSCAAWIDSIHRGIDVARAAGLRHIAGATGRTSEAAIAALHGLPPPALIEMGDFVGGLLRYLRRHPVARLTIAGGIGKLGKLAQGRLDLHSRRGSIDMPALAALTGNQAIATATTVAEAFGIDPGIADHIARHAWRTAADALAMPAIALDIAVFDRSGVLVAHHGAPR